MRETLTAKLCQSNMDWSLEFSSKAISKVFGARFPDLHLFKVPQRPSLQPQSDVDVCLKTCSHETVKEFSVVLGCRGRSHNSNSRMRNTLLGRWLHRRKFNPAMLDVVAGKLEITRYA